MMKKLLSVIVVLAVVFNCAPCVRADDVPTVSARAYALYCANNGEFIMQGSADERLPMASTTKILTALIALEYAARDNREVEFTEDMITEGSSMYLEVGERVTLYDLAVGMMMQSGNDAATAAAVTISGSVEKFTELMNSKAREIGMKNSGFVTPSGLDADGHYSTAHDMALLMACAMRNKSFRDITSHTEMTVDFIYPPDKSVTYPNHNKLLRLYDGCISGKTGYTDSAGRCLVTAAERDGLLLIAVTLDDGDDWDDHAAMYDYGFSLYKGYTPDGDVNGSLNMVGGTADTVKLRTKPCDTIAMSADNIGKINRTVYLPAFVYAPVSRSQRLGSIIYTIDNKKIAEIPILADEDIGYRDT